MFAIIYSSLIILAGMLYFFKDSILKFIDELMFF